MWDFLTHLLAYLFFVLLGIGPALLGVLAGYLLDEGDPAITPE